jgi:hypothetical protein
MLFMQLLQVQLQVLLFQAICQLPQDLCYLQNKPLSKQSNVVKHCSVNVQCMYHGEQVLLARGATPLGHISARQLVGQTHSLTSSLHSEGHHHFALPL